MFDRILLILTGAALSTAWAGGSHEAFKVDESKRLALPCRAESKHVGDTWYVNVDRNPDQPEKFSSGEFNARITVWVTFKKGQQLVTLYVRNHEDSARVDTGRVSTGQMLTGERITSVEKPAKCEAFAAGA
jgi:hypothetical protein